MSYGIYIGKNFTRTGFAWLAGYGDEPSSHWLEIHPKRQHRLTEKIRVGVTRNAEMPGRMTEIPQVSVTARNIRVNYSHYKGVPAPITNGGLNEYGVAVRDVWSPSRKELINMTPKDQTGLNYSDLSKIILERAKTALEGVQIISDLIMQYGESTYGGNSHIIADSKEAWIIIEFAGGQGLWVAERLGENSIRVSRPGYIGELPLNDLDTSNFLFSPNLFSFAKEKGWYKSGSFNANEVYGDGKGRWLGVEWIEKEIYKLSKRPEKVSIPDVIWALRTSKLTSDRSGYGQIIPLVEPKNNNLRYLWHSPVGPVSAPFSPIFMGHTMIPDEYQMHGYLTSGESSKFMDNSERLVGFSEQISDVVQSVEASRCAVYEAKRLFYLMLQAPKKYTKEVTETFEKHEQILFKNLEAILIACELLLKIKETSKAKLILTYFSNNSLLGGLEIIQKMADSLHLRHRLKPKRQTDQKLKMYDQIW